MGTSAMSPSSEASSGRKISVPGYSSRAGVAAEPGLPEPSRCDQTLQDAFPDTFESAARPGPRPARR